VLQSLMFLVSYSAETKGVHITQLQSVLLAMRAGGRFKIGSRLSERNARSCLQWMFMRGRADPINEGLVVFVRIKSP
jgi:hypothetical protein